MTRARVFTFHADSRQLPGIIKALDGVAERVAKHPDFRGLVCLEHDNVRNEVIVVTRGMARGWKTQQPKPRPPGGRSPTPSTSA